MLNLYSFSIKKEDSSEILSDKDKFSIYYHDLFDYPLDFSGLVKWQYGGDLHGMVNMETSKSRGYYFIRGREGLIYKNLLRKRISAKKITIAEKSAKILSFVPGVRMVGITGSLAMANSPEDGDIDLLIITKKGTLWTTRFLVYVTLRLFGIAVRKPNSKLQKDHLCLNMWLDETDLVWRKSDRNVYTAHEIAQIVPLVGKHDIYEKLLSENSWILDYWPKSVKIAKKINRDEKNRSFVDLLGFIEKVLYKLQTRYMEAKKTNETVTATRAFFHPYDWGKVVLGRLPS